MSELQFCTFFLNGIYLGINVQNVQEVIRSQEITRVPLAPSDICGLINLRGKIVTVIDLKSSLEMNNCDFPSVSESVDEQGGFNVVVCAEDEVVSLQVDDIGEIVQIKQENFEPPPATLKGRIRELLQGAYKLQEGFLLVLDAKKILDVETRLIG
ncbi:chemotaxis protein CheW [Aetokthonos hydrillicola Thurmond2011]|jgi:purine-binding chemotaxis protein CheW|uniref:Chemotaxis protein CheW n=3 Tax=Aetokthonos TaxID=1550243 RepID=A0AAP5I6W8_9CYAN|nr:chemotaxis protein CheW [Aetokthonos hydrillicola]MBO3459345.1 chemotaxis protein CheW [Aetokthonos hydrillicola CCALA 1050]MBW4586491.1 chemotaxis protein CheW [Aetokthonos hydrillicola CCALA 1050]MDR9893565.1 chemotaxis protein CheW [Aetokthonos hydrillicola Thurmond2011]